VRKSNAAYPSHPTPHHTLSLVMVRLVVICRMSVSCGAPWRTRGEMKQTAPRLQDHWSGTEMQHSPAAQLSLLHAGSDAQDISVRQVGPSLGKPCGGLQLCSHLISQRCASVSVETQVTRQPDRLPHSGSIPIFIV